jgi:chromosome partitioning protein
LTGLRITPQADDMNTPPFIITFASPKGGVGKSTTCLAIGAALASRGEPVLILDLDQTNTLIRWYEQHQPGIPGLTVDTVPEVDLYKRLTALYLERTGYILIDLAGALSDVMLNAAAIAHLTITPAKLSEPDILEATKLHHQLARLAKSNRRPITHRILINEASALLPTYQRHILDQIAMSPLQRFDTLMHQRALR